VSEATLHTWTCPSCGRRVPLRSEACHCGMTRARAQQLAARPRVAAAPRVARGLSDRQAALQAMPGDVKLLFSLSALVLVAGLFWLGFAPRPEPYPAVLGFVDPGPPKSTRPTGPERPPFKLPWWK